MARAEPQVNVRLPADLKARLDAAAGNSRRSLTAEIVARLERTFADDQQQAVKAAVQAATSAAQGVIDSAGLPTPRPFQRRLSELYEEAEARLLDEMKAAGHKTFSDAAANSRHAAKKKA